MALRVDIERRAGLDLLQGNLLALVVLERDACCLVTACPDDEISGANKLCLVPEGRRLEHLHALLDSATELIVEHFCVAA